MKNLSLLLLSMWCGWILYTTPNLKPSDNLFLLLLSCISVMYVVISLIIKYCNYITK